MYYWSRWTNITTEAETRDEQETRPSWREADYQQKRETRPVVVIKMSNAQVMSAMATRQHSQRSTRETASRISLDVRRQAYARTTSPRIYTSAGHSPDATTEEVLAK